MDEYGFVIRTGAVSGICAAILGIGVTIVVVITSVTPFDGSRALILLASILANVAGAIYQYGFAMVGKKYSNRLLEFASYALIVVFVVEILYSILLYVSPSQLMTSMVDFFDLYLSSFVGLFFLAGLIMSFSRLGYLSLVFCALSLVLDLGLIDPSAFALIGVFLEMVLYIVGSSMLFRAANLQQLGVSMKVS